jgi:glycosyltransferase involved in cell wall biosynthesis
MTILVAQLGARRHYVVPRALHSLGMLEGLTTDLCADLPPWPWIRAIWPIQLRPRSLRRLLARRVPDLPPRMIRDLPTFAFSPASRRRRKERGTDYWARRNAAFGRAASSAGFGAAEAVYAFNAAAVEVFEAARERGARTILDQTAAPWRWNKRILTEEIRRWPGWEIAPAEIDVSDALSEREEREWRLADRIICGSDFAARAVDECGGPANRCVVVPYPSQTPWTPPETPARTGVGKLRILFVGSLQLRKGVQYLAEAKRLLRGQAVEIRLVGPSLLSDRAMAVLNEDLEVLGPAPRDEVRRHYGWADALVLPTLSEGSANVCHEALAAGLPVITTPNAGSTIRDGVDGLIVPIREASAIADAIRRLTDRETLLRLSANARAASSRSFGQYARELGNAIEPG